MAAKLEPLAVVEAAYHQHFEVQPDRAAVSFLGVEQIEVLRYSGAESVGAEHLDHYLTLGMSRHPMVESTATVIDEAAAPRAELMMSAAGRPQDLWRKLAVLAAAPAVEAAVYAAGNRVDLGEPLCSGSRCTGAVLAEGTLSAIAVSGMAEVVVLALLPATQTELAWARVHGSDALRLRWAEAGTNLADLMRDPVALS
jgi:hypothetical protein